MTSHENKTTTTKTMVKAPPPYPADAPEAVPLFVGYEMGPHGVLVVPTRQLPFVIFACESYKIRQLLSAGILRPRGDKLLQLPFGDSGKKPEQQGTLLWIGYRLYVFRNIKNPQIANGQIRATSHVLSRLTLKEDGLVDNILPQIHHEPLIFGKIAVLILCPGQYPAVVFAGNPDGRPKALEACGPVRSEDKKHKIQQIPIDSDGIIQINNVVYTIRMGVCLFRPEGVGYAAIN